MCCSNWTCNIFSLSNGNAVKTSVADEDAEDEDEEKDDSEENDEKEDIRLEADGSFMGDKGV